MLIRTHHDNTGKVLNGTRTRSKKFAFSLAADGPDGLRYERETSPGAGPDTAERIKSFGSK